MILSAIGDPILERVLANFEREPIPCEIIDFRANNKNNNNNNTSLKDFFNSKILGKREPILMKGAAWDRPTSSWTFQTILQTIRSNNGSNRKKDEEKLKFKAYDGSPEVGGTVLKDITLPDLLEYLDKEHNKFINNNNDNNKNTNNNNNNTNTNNNSNNKGKEGEHPFSKIYVQQAFEFFWNFPELKKGMALNELFPFGYYVLPAAWIGPKGSITGME